MKHILSFSGGKDSQATALWCMDNLDDFDIVFCDTGWEHDITYEFIDSFGKEIGKDIIKIKSKKYSGFYDMTLHKKRVASSQARFCTEELKVKVMIDYILDEVGVDVKIYQGIRRQESANRAFLDRDDDFFKFYFDPYGFDKNDKPKYHTYRSKEIKKLKYSVDVCRPIITWDHQRVFNFIKDHGQSWNPLYDFGSFRVGCFPCVMVNKDELFNMMQAFPEIEDKIVGLEKAVGRTFFKPNYIPERFHDCFGKNKDGEDKSWATAKVVFKYVKDRHATGNLFHQFSSCRNVYVPCQV